MKLTFWGAARTVTGSMHEVTVDGQRWLLDCGLYQGRRQEAFERNRNLPFPARNISGVVLSHAHIDHSGNLPTLGKAGFSGSVYAAPGTGDLCDAMLRDSAFLQEKDAEFVNKRQSRRRNGKEIDPLYRIEDAAKIMEAFHKVPYREERALSDSLGFEFSDAGHLLGSAVTRIEHRHNGRRVRLVFSGDLGRKGMPLLRDPEPCPEGDYLILESTYGGRLHKEEAAVEEKLAGVVNRTAERGGKVIIPAFAVGRTQQIVWMLHQLSDRNAIPRIPVFVDSPLAINATEVFRRHRECYDEETARFLEQGEDPLSFGMLKYIREAADSKKLNDLHGPMIIISASGMCEAGRILHHLRNNIGDPRNTVLIVGFQAEHTLGRKLVEEHQEVPIFGEPMRLRAQVVTINELSGHADRKGLVEWIQPVARGFRRVFLVHGELAEAEVLASLIRVSCGLDVVIPQRGQSFGLE